jgi:hypothetical protein
MMRGNILAAVVIGLIFVGFCLAPHVNGQDPVDYTEILGEWNMEVDAGGEYFYLSFSIEKSDEGMKGAISESSGFFSDVSLENIEFDSTNLSFEMKIPTPPDGYENLVKATLELIEGKFEGTLSVESLGISAAATATKKTELFILNYS